MSAEFNWWLLIVGLVVGAGLTWLVLADARRREEDLEEAELASEAAWLESATADLGSPVDAATAEQVLRLHRSYLGLDAGDSVVPADEDPALEWWTRLEGDTPPVAAEGSGAFAEAVEAPPAPAATGAKPESPASADPDGEPAPPVSRPG